jgi:ATP-dependent DNA helicase RecQ
MSEPLEVLRKVFGYDAFRGAQAAIIDHVLAGGDALVLMPTGGGKSLCYQIPSIVRRGTGIVVSPLIALMQDQVDALRQLGVRAAFLNSSLDSKAAGTVLRDARRGELDLLYVAPERLVTESFLTHLAQIQSEHGLALFAIDEAHCVSQWGHDFRPEYIQLSILHERFPDVPRIGLTATADAITRAEIKMRLALMDAREFVASFDRPNIRYRVVEKDQPREQLLGFLRGSRDEEGHLGQAGIVYCASRKKVDETTAWLEGKGITALAYHAGMNPQSRRETQQLFQSDDGTVMVATIAFGMGIDKPDVRFVAHLDLPKSLEAYYQETGRAGRDGEPADAWMSYGLADVVLQKSWIEQSEAPPEQKRIEQMKLDAMLGFCEAAQCRRAVLLNYFGESIAACGNCDVCLDPPQTWDATIPAQKLFSAILRTGQRFGAGHLIDVLRGNATERVASLGHDRLPTFGVGVDLDEKAWRSVARQLVALGLLHADPHAYGALRLTDAARPALKGETRLELRRPAIGGRRAGRKPRSKGSAGLPLGSATETLFEALRAERKRIADEQGVPAYVVLHDSTLRQLAQLRPRDREDLLQVSGIGITKAERYGERLLAIISKVELAAADRG